MTFLYQLTPCLQRRLPARVEPASQWVAALDPWLTSAAQPTVSSSALPTSSCATGSPSPHCAGSSLNIRSALRRVFAKLYSGLCNLSYPTPSFYLNEVYMAPGLGYAQRARQQISATYTYGQPVSEQPGPSRPAPPARPTLPSRRPRLPLNDSESSDEEDLFDWMKGVWDDEWGDEEPPERCENCGKKSLDGRCVACESVLFSSGPMSRRLRAGGVWSLRLQDGSSGAACFARVRRASPEAFTNTYCRGRFT